MGVHVVPITPAAILYDLDAGGDKAWGLEPPYRRLGPGGDSERRARFRTLAASAQAVGPRPAHGLAASARRRCSSGTDLVVGALAAVNPLGSVYHGRRRDAVGVAVRAAGRVRRHARPQEFRRRSRSPCPSLSRLQARLKPAANTTLGVIAVSAELTGAECKRVAIMAHDGMARAIRPAHTPFDGDIVFVAARGSAMLGAARAAGGGADRLGGGGHPGPRDRTRRLGGGASGLRRRPHSATGEHLRQFGRRCHERTWCSCGCGAASTCAAGPLSTIRPACSTGDVVGELAHQRQGRG